MTQYITALFDNRSDANTAIDRLVGAGISRSSIRLLPESDTSYGSTSSGTSYDVDRDDKGFWASLADFFFPDDDRYSYAEAMNRGDVMVTVTAADEDASRAEDILEELGTVSIDEREQSWRAEGWQGYGRGEFASSATSGTATSGTATSSTASTYETEDETIPVVEEELQIGKRRVNEGRVKVRSYVVETPVSEDVELRDESIEIERRPVDRPLTGSEDAFRDRTIEAEAVSEEAVVAKTARVKEELALKKNVDRRTETVTDTVRSTEVEIDDDRNRRKAGQRQR